MVQPISSTSALLKAKGGTKYRHDDRHRAEIYAVNRLLQDHENSLYDEFIENMKTRMAKGLSTDVKFDGGKHESESDVNYGDEVDDDDDAKSDTSSVVPSPEQRRIVAGVALTPSSPKVVADETSSPFEEDDDINNKKTITIPSKSKLSKMLNKGDASFNAV